jgi:ABC-2 type transport system permease protein
MTDVLNDVREVAAGTQRVTQPLYWSVRRELWENRSIYLAPLLVAGFVLFATILANTIPLASRLARAAALSPAKQREIVTMPLSAVAGTTIFVAFIVGFFYCLDALYGERRDRSILFWKSLPVSDRTAVLAKASIPMLVLPLIVFVIVVTAQVIMIVLNTLRLLGNGPALALLWSHLKFFQMTIAFLYGLAAIALWHAPVYAWLLLVSGRVKHAAVLWAILPFLAIGAVERLLFRTTHVIQALGYRMTGWYHRGFVFPPKGTTVAVDPLAHLTPGEFLSSPGLWAGILLTVLFLALAVRMRRNREPI